MTVYNSRRFEDKFFFYMGKQLEVVQFCDKMDVETQIHPSTLTRASSSVCDGTRKPDDDDDDDDVGIVFFFLVVVVDRGGASTNAAKTTRFIFSRNASTRAQGW